MIVMVAVFKKMISGALGRIWLVLHTNTFVADQEPELQCSIVTINNENPGKKTLDYTGNIS